MIPSHEEVHAETLRRLKEIYGIEKFPSCLDPHREEALKLWRKVYDEMKENGPSPRVKETLF